MAAIALLLLAALPSLIDTVFVRTKILAAINRTLAPGRLAVDRFELSWTGPTRLVGFKLIAPNGSRVAEAPVAELSHTLGALILGRAGAVLTLDRAALAIERRSDGEIDLIEALRAVIAHPDPQRDLTVRIRDGSLVFRADGVLDPIVARSADFELKINPSPRAMTWNLELGHAGGGSLVAKGDMNRWTARDANPNQADLRLELEARRWPIAHRSTGLATAGELDGMLDLTRRSGRWGVEANTRLIDLVATGDRLAGDSFQPGPITVVADLGQNSDGWNIRRLTLDSALGSVRAEGRLGPGRGLGSTQGVAQRVEGRLDLAAIARQLPRSLRLRPGLVVEGGTVRLVAGATGPPDRSMYSLEATVADLVARDGDRRLSLRDPATLAAEVIRAGDDLAIKRLTARTPFLNAAVTGRLDDATLSGSVDLGEFRKQLGDWFDIGSLDGSGRAEIAGTYQVVDHRYAGEIRSKIENFLLSGTAAGPIERPLATLTLTAHGRPDAAGWPVDLDSAELSAGSGSSSARLELNASGELIAVGARVVAGLPGSGPDRRVEATLAGSWDNTRRTLNCDRILARLLPTPSDRAEHLLLVARGEIAPDAGTIRFDPIDGPTSTQAPVRLGPGGIKISGLGRDLTAVRVDGQLEGSLSASDPESKPTPWSASVQALGEGQGVRFSARAAVGPEGGRSANGSAGSLVIEGRYQKSPDRIELSDCRIASPFGGCTASGRLDDPIGGRRFDVQGQATPDFAAITTWLQGRVEPGARLAGQARSFHFRGAASGPEPMNSVEGEVGFDLLEADVYGMKLGPTPVVLRARGGQILVDPISTTLNEGHIRLEPEIVLADSKGDPLLRLGKNSSIRDAMINDEVSRRVLSFVAPILEGTTRASGRVSVDLDHAQIPLRSGRSRSALVDGQVVFEDVAFAPGPLANDLLGAIGRRDLSLKLDRPVTLTIADGRINQSGLALPVGDLTRIEIAGWVDFDRNLALTATLPVTPAMLGNNAFLSDIAAGTQVRLPVGGTLNHPVIDRDALTASLKDLGKSLLTRGAARGALELLMRVGRPKEPNAPLEPPPPSPEERKALRQERRADRKAQRNAPAGPTPKP